MSNQILEQIQFTNLDQFVNDVNKALATLSNSLNHAPGSDGLGGNQGNQGLRGSSFLFVNLQKFQSVWAGQFVTGSDITINFINIQLQQQETTQKLMLALSVSEFVENDIFVLTNSLMCRYTLESPPYPKIVSTTVSFNEGLSISANITNIVREEVNLALNNNDKLNSLASVFTAYPTLAKNYADNNNVNVNRDILPTSAYSPFIDRYNTSIGVPVSTHKYFGFPDNMWGDPQYGMVSDSVTKSYTGTLIMGSVRKYYELLQKTLKTDDGISLTSDYAPGVGNVPSFVLLQDTTNAGILFGYKDNTEGNLKSFGSLYKNENGDVVIESDSGKLDSEFSRLLINKNRLKYNKSVEFGNTLLVSGKTTLGGDVNNKGFRTGSFTKNGNISPFNPNVTEVGVYSDGGVNSLTINVANRMQYSNYSGNVLVTDSTGVLQKTYSLETQILGNTNLLDLNALERVVNSPNKFLTSNYYDYLASKLNNVSSFINGNYWKKSEFNSGIIPQLRLGSTLTVDGIISLSGLITTSVNAQATAINGASFIIGSTNVNFGSFIDKVLVTDVTGFLTRSFSVEKSGVDGSGMLPALNANNRFITSDYYNLLSTRINNISSNSLTNYWTKTEMANRSINQSILLQAGTTLGTYGDLDVNPANSGSVLLAQNNLVQLGNNSETATVRIKGNKFYAESYANSLLFVNGSGLVTNTYKVESVNFVGNTSDGNSLISSIPSSTLTNLPTTSHVNFLGNKLNAVITTIANLSTSNIPEGTRPYFSELKVRNTTLSGFVSGNGTISASDTVLSAIQKLDGRISGGVNNDAYSSAWNGVTNISPSKGALFNKIESIVSDAVYANTWYGDTNIAPSKKAVHEKIEYMITTTPPFDNPNDVRWQDPEYANKKTASLASLMAEFTAMKNDIVVALKYGVPVYAGYVVNIDPGNGASGESVAVYNEMVRIPLAPSITATIQKIGACMEITFRGMVGFGSRDDYRLEITVDRTSGSSTSKDTDSKVSHIGNKISSSSFSIILNEYINAVQKLTVGYTIYTAR